MENRKNILSGRRMSQRDIVEAVCNPDSVTILGEKSPKAIVIPTTSEFKANFEKLARDMKIEPGSKIHNVVLLFCKEKRASSINAKVFIARIRNLNEEQLKAVGSLCRKKEFTATNILKSITSIRKYDKTRLLVLRSFIELKNVNPGNLHHFFINTLPQLNREEAGEEAYKNEIKSMMMSPIQNNAFYTICKQIEGISPSNAIILLQKIKKFKPQHSTIINMFLRKGAVFGEKSVTADNIKNLIKLWLNLPELTNKKKFNQLIKKINKKKEMKMDFQYIITAYKNEIMAERSKGKLFSFFRQLFS